MHTTPSPREKPWPRSQLLEYLQRSGALTRTPRSEIIMEIDRLKPSIVELLGSGIVAWARNFPSGRPILSLDVLAGFGTGMVLATAAYRAWQQKGCDVPELIELREEHGALVFPSLRPSMVNRPLNVILVGHTLTTQLLQAGRAIRNMGHRLTRLVLVIGPVDKIRTRRLDNLEYDCVALFREQEFPALSVQGL